LLDIRKMEETKDAEVIFVWKYFRKLSFRIERQSYQKTNLDIQERGCEVNYTDMASAFSYRRLFYNFEAWFLTKSN
jgi:hypothetical protein